MSRERDYRFEEVVLPKKTKRQSTDAASSSLMGRRSLVMNMISPPSGVLNTVTPCAACKLLRRRCAEECPFSPYFSPHEPHKFAAVHKVFGASNVSKMLLEVPESQRADAANSLVYEANLRLRDPVYGCMGAISALQQQIQSLQAEVNAVRSEILKYKYREATTSLLSSASLISSGVVSVIAPNLTTAQNQHQQQQHQPQPPGTPTPPPPQPQPPPPPPPSIVISSSSSSTNASNLYSSITASDHHSGVPYFD
ncbi:LOB domain-containing protein 13 [Linum grandiflorum]